jgi:hypothetical protein
MEKRNTRGEFALTAEFFDKQFTNYVLPDGQTASIIRSSIFNVTLQHCVSQAKADAELFCPALPLNTR